MRLKKVNQIGKSHQLRIALLFQIGAITTVSIGREITPIKDSVTIPIKDSVTIPNWCDYNG